MQKRTQKFAVSTIKFIETLPNRRALNVLSNQLLRSSSSVGANYRSACKGKSVADFINKITICEEEADESIYWLDLMIESELIDAGHLVNLKKEATELTAIFTAIGKTTKENQKKNKNK